MVAVVTTMCVTVYVSMTQIATAVRDNDASVAQLNTSAAVISALVERQNAVRGYVASGDASFKEKIEKNDKAYDEAIAKLEKMAPEDKALVDQLKAEADKVEGEENQQVAMAENAATRPQAQAVLAHQGRLTKVREALAAYDGQEKEVLAKYSKAQDASQHMAEMMLIVGGVLSAALAALMGWVLTRAIAKPIGEMTAAMGRLAAGDNTVEVPAVGRKDEVGSMAGAVQHFKDAAIEKIRLEGEAAEQRKAAEAQRAATAKQQAMVVDGLATGLEKLAAGTLTFRLNDAFAPEYEKLRSDFNAAMGQMQETMCEVAVNATGVRSGAGEISQASDNLSRRTEQQAASLEETAAALDQITATVRKTAEGAGQARDSVGAARADAERSGVVVRDAVSAMSEIEASAQQISQIIGVIDEIAFQTNLLALNAGVEAARAGDAGRGFAVVASEVRALAQRSADAAKEIKTLISASSQQVERGVGLVGETGKVLERILNQVTQINGVVTDIAASAQEQATGLQQVNTAVNQMDQVTQQNAAMVEEATAASHALAGEAETLSRLISRFELGNQGKAAASTSHAAPAHAAPAVPARPQGRSIQALKNLAVRGATALAAEPSADGWDEF